MLDRLRAEIEPVSAKTLMRMLLRWQRVDEQAHGPEGLRTVLQILDGLPAAAAAWEESVLPARVADYQPAWLDALCLSGELRWVCVGGTASSVVRAAPVALCSPETAALLAQPGAASGEPTADLSADARAVQDALRRRGASFFRDLQLASGRLRTQAEAGLA